MFSETLYNKNEDKKDGDISVSLPKEFWGGILAVNVNCELDISLESPDGAVWKKRVFPEDRIQIFKILKKKGNAQPTSQPSPTKPTPSASVLKIKGHTQG